jgi:hypothetical protein
MYCVHQMSLFKLARQSCFSFVCSRRSWGFWSSCLWDAVCPYLKPSVAHAVQEFILDCKIDLFVIQIVIHNRLLRSGSAAGCSQRNHLDKCCHHCCCYHPGSPGWVHCHRCHCSIPGIYKKSDCRVRILSERLMLRRIITF